LIRGHALTIAIALTLTLTVMGPASAGAQVADTAAVKPDPPGTPFFTRQDAVLAGGFVVGAIVLAQADQRLARTFQDPDLQESAGMRRGADFFRWMGDPAPQLIGLSLYAVGRVARDRPIAALGLHALEGLILADALTAMIKAGAGRARPYVDTPPDDFDFLRGFRGHEFTSFPSGHTTGAFAVAAVTTAEIAHWTGEKGWWPGWPYLVGGTLFGGATLVGVSRMYHDQHWASDIVAGAAIGTFGGLKVVKYAYRHPENRLDRWLLPVSVAPGGDGAMVVAWTIPIGRPTPRRLAR
jgi:membrane-associated phospholipid phosphatase